MTWLQADKDGSGSVDYIEFADQMKPKEFSGISDIEADRARAARGEPDRKSTQPRSSGGSRQSSARRVIAMHVCPLTALPVTAMYVCPILLVSPAQPMNACQVVQD